MKFAIPIVLALIGSCVYAQTSAKASASTPAKPMPQGPASVTVYAPCPVCPVQVVRPVHLVQNVGHVGIAVAARGQGFFAGLIERIKHILPHRSVSRSRAITRCR